MATPRAWTALARSRPTPIPTYPILRRHHPANNHHLTAAAAAATAHFSTTISRPATTEGAPPTNFRLSKPSAPESVWDRAGNYFLLTEMLRGMYVVLEQFFRPPYAPPPVSPPPFAPGLNSPLPGLTPLLPFPRR